MVGHSPSGSGGSRDSSEERSSDSDFAILSGRLRRAVLARLVDHSQVMTLADRVEAVAVHETGWPIAQILDEELRDIRLTLHDPDLPKLAAENIIEHDPERSRIRSVNAADRIARDLSLATDNWMPS